MEALRPLAVTLIALSIVTGCSVTTKGSFCQISSPIRLSDKAVDALSDAEVANILARNETGAKLCGWTP